MNYIISPYVHSFILGSCRPFEWFVFQAELDMHSRQLHPACCPSFSFWYSIPVEEMRCVRMFVARVKLSESSFGPVVTLSESKATNLTKEKPVRMPYVGCLEGIMEARHENG